MLWHGITQQNDGKMFCWICVLGVSTFQDRGSCQEDEGFQCGGGQYPCLPHWKFDDNLAYAIGSGDLFDLLKLAGAKRGLAACYCFN